MKKSLVVLLVLSFLNSAAFLTSFPVIARASPTSEVCIATLDSNSCPSSPTVFGAVGGQLTVAINVQDSEPISGFDIRVHTDSTVLNPISITYSDTIIHGPTALATECINDPHCGCMNDSSCASFSLGDADLTLLSQGFALTPSPTTGRLFEITYDILKNSTETLISFATNSSCSDSSVAFTTICVGLISAPAMVELSGVQVAAFSNLPAPVVITQTTPPTLNVQDNEQSIIDIVSTNGFRGTLNLAHTVPAGLECGKLPSSIEVPPDTEVIFSCTTSIPGIYVAAVNATSDAGPVNFQVRFVFGGFEVHGTVSYQDVGLYAYTNAYAGLGPTYGFAGVVDVKWTIPHNLDCVSPIGTSQSIQVPTALDTYPPGLPFITFSCAATLPGVYSINLTATSNTTGSFSSSALVVFIFSDFSISPRATSISIVKGSLAHLGLTASGLVGFQGMLSFNATLSPTTNHPPFITLSPVSAAITPSNPNIGFDLTVMTNHYTTLGTYSLIITATTIVSFSCTRSGCSHYLLVHTSIVTLIVVPSTQNLTIT